MLNRFAALAVALLTAVLVAACGSQAHPPKTVKLPPVVKACPEAQAGKGAPGVCAPGTVAPLLAARASSASTTGITYPDFSNNDPCYCAAGLKAHGHPGEIDKVNQGVGFIDSTFPRMAADAKAHRLIVGGYDFDQEYTAREAYVFVERLHRAGIYRGTPRTFPPTLDVEWGMPSRSGLEHQLAVLSRVFGRAQIYTGGWYWLPHFGCWVPPHVAFWLSGYPVAELFCGLVEAAFVAHQFTDHGYNGAGFSDMTVWRGSTASFATFTQSGPMSTQRHAGQRRALRAQEALRRELHGDIERHHCRLGQHATPRSYHTVCGRWLHEGNAAIRVIARYHREGVR